MQLRSFQNQALRLRNRILEGNIRPRDLYADITPGGGKSTLPVIFSALIPSFAQKICWVVPRKSLSVQAEKTFTNRTFRMLFNHKKSIRHNYDNTPDPCRGCDGYVTTYQAIASNPDLHAQEFSRYRYILFLDEPHHLEASEHRSWVAAISPLVDKAVLRIYASGTFERGDRRPISFLPYENHAGGYALNLPHDETTIRYSRREALEEHAIVPLSFRVIDGTAHWIGTDGEEIRIESFDVVSPRQNSHMVQCALQTEFAKKVLNEGIALWKAYKQENPQAKILVVAPTQPIAREYSKYLEKQCDVPNSIAISDEGKDSYDAIECFKGEKTPSINALVTVGMAYEGLDVPDITHVICLTRYRSKPWLEQCFARANRISNPKKQDGFIFVPDDPIMRTVIDALMREQQAVIVPREERRSNIDTVEGPDDVRATIIPLSSDATQHRMIDLNGEFVGRLETARLDKILKASGLHGIVTPLQLRRAFEVEKYIDKEQEFNPPINDDMTPSEKESRMRSAIEDHCRSADLQSENDYGTTNGLVKAEFRKSRTEMSCEELLRVWKWLQVHCPLKKYEETL